MIKFPLLFRGVKLSHRYIGHTCVDRTYITSINTYITYIYSDGEIARGRNCKGNTIVFSI